MRTAVLIDGCFFLRRYTRLRGREAPSEVAKAMHRMALSHLETRGERRSLYRILYYDCPPISKRVHDPTSGRAIDFSRTPVAVWRIEYLRHLTRLRKLALRLGRLNERAGHWVLRTGVLADLLQGRLNAADLTESHVQYDVRQKGVDMRLGLDIASLAYKRQVDQIVLVSGDSDFVPAAKLARREGIDFVLDPMWATIASDLAEHVDGVRSVLPRLGQDADSST